MFSFGAPVRPWRHSQASPPSLTIPSRLLHARRRAPTGRTGSVAGQTVQGEQFEKDTCPSPG